MFKESPQAIEVINPATFQPMGSFPVDDEIKIETLLDASEKAFAGWCGLSVRERGCYALRLKAVIYARREEIVQTISASTGKPKVEALTAELIPVLNFISYFVKRAPRVLSDTVIPLHLLKYKKSLLRYEPYGVVAVISPWNFPFSIPMGDVILAVLAGNTVILKTSESVLPVAKIIQDLFKEAGFPEGVLQAAYGGGKTGACLTSSPRVKKIVFTGSTEVGKKILAQAAKNITPCVLELGGKDAAIVREDANLDRAIPGIVWGAFTNAGQVCASIERVYVARSIAQPFSERLIQEIRKLKLKEEVGAITLPSHIQTYERLLEDAVRQGAKILTGGMAGQKEKGSYFQPTALINVSQRMAIMREETFGPILPIMMVDSDEEAVRLTNDSLFGLGASIWTRDVRKGIAMAKKIQAGTVTINDSIFTAGLAETPWGGVKQSGIGRVHSDIGLKEFVQPKHINYERFSVKPFWWFPYTANSYETALSFAGVVGAPKLSGKIKSLVRFLNCYLFKR